MRATLRLSSPAWLAQPSTTSSTASSRRRDCAPSAPGSGCAARSSVRTDGQRAGVAADRRADEIADEGFGHAGHSGGTKSANRRRAPLETYQETRAYSRREQCGIVAQRRATVHRQAAALTAADGGDHVRHSSGAGCAAAHRGRARASFLRGAGAGLSRTGRSPWLSATAPAARPISRRGSSPRTWKRRSASRSRSRTGPAATARSRRARPTTPSPTATRSP